MRSSVRNFLGGALAVAALVMSSIVPASAQSASTNETTRVNFDAATAVAPVASSFTPKLHASFQAQQSQLGPSNSDSGIAVGVLGMITRTSWRGDENLGTFSLDNKTGYGFGLWVGGNRNGLIGFTGEFIYVVRGNDEFRTKALQIPAVFHINFGSSTANRGRGYLVLGPSFTVNLKQEANGVDISDNFNGADVGLIGGAGVEVLHIGIEARGNWGLRNISKSGDVTNTKTFTFEVLGKFAFN